MKRALLLAVALWSASASAQSTRELRLRAADLTYNLDHDEAIALLRQAVAADPNDPLNHRALASAVWLDILFKRGAVTVDVLILATGFHGFRGLENHGFITSTIRSRSGLG